MLNYTPQNQLDIFSFRTEFEGKLDPDNRWVKMAKLLDWDSFASIYGENLSSTMGAKGIDARVVVGALIIKHLDRKDDRGTIEMISENPYMQFFLGFDHFSSEPIFDPSLFVHIRKRLGNDSFDEMNEIIINKALTLNDLRAKKANPPQADIVEPGTGPTQNGSQKTANKGKLQLGATVADAHIRYPTDLGLLNDSREKSDELIDILCRALETKKPRT